MLRIKNSLKLAMTFEGDCGIWNLSLQVIRPGQASKNGADTADPHSQQAEGLLGLSIHVSTTLLKDIIKKKITFSSE